MILTRITAVGTDGSRVMLWFDDGSKMRASTSMVAEFGLYGGMELEEQDLEHLMDAAQRASARNRAVRIVSTTAVSERQLQQKLIRKGERPEDAKEATEWLHSIGALDDHAMAGRITESCIRKGYGKNRIRQELIQKGIPREYRDEALENLPDLSASVDHFLERKLGSQAPDQKELQKVCNALARRGFSWAEISAGLRRWRETLEELPDDLPELPELYD